MITTVNCDLSLQSTCQLVNLSTRQLQIMITDIVQGLNSNHKVQSSMLKTQMSKDFTQRNRANGGGT